MEIALIRGDFISPSELANFRPLTKRHHVTVFTGLNPVWDVSLENDFEIIQLPSPVDLNFGKIKRPIMSVLNRTFTDAHVLFGLEEKLKGFDIAHTAETYYFYTQQCLNAKKKKNVKKVISTVWENIPFNNEGIAGRKEFKKRALKEVDLFLPVTNRAKEVLVNEGCDKTKIKVLNPGVNLKLFRPFSQKHKRLRLLVVSRLVPEKGISEIVAIASHFPGVELVLAGSGPIKPKGATLLGKVGYYDMPKVYNSCDILIHYPIGSQTWSEQYGMALVEAMACGLPIVALNRGSIPEIVASGGLVVSRENFPQTLMKVISDQKYRRVLSQRAVSYAENHYNAIAYAANLEKLYQFVLVDKEENQS